MKKLIGIYSQIPTFTCKVGCTGCCGPVPWAKEEWDKITDKRVATDIHCPYSGKGYCEVYADRPFVCRIFGATLDPRLKCPYGCAPKKPLTIKQTNKLSAVYFKLMKEEG